MSNHVHLVFSRSGPDSHSDIVNKIKENSGVWSSGLKLQTCAGRGESPINKKLKPIIHHHIGQKHIDFMDDEAGIIVRFAHTPFMS